MLLCLRPATVSTVGVQLWRDRPEARSGESQGSLSPWELLYGMEKSQWRIGGGPEKTRPLNHVSTLCYSGFKTKSSTQQWKGEKKAEKTHYTCAQSKGKEPGSRTVIQKFTLQQSQLCVNLSVIHLSYNMVMSFRRSCCDPYVGQLHTPISQNLLGTKVFSAAQIKPWEEIVGPNVTARPGLKAKSVGVAQPSGQKDQLFVLGSFTNKQHSLELPTDQPGIYFKNRELVKDLCRGTSPSALNISCPTWSLTKSSATREAAEHCLWAPAGKAG